jgi:hypothetical protein
MAMNRVQFQAGLSMPDFLKDYGSEAQCEQALEAIRWPTGFSCPRCGHAAHYALRDGARKVFQCNACRHQASLIAGTVFQGTKLPLTIWFLAIYLISQAKTGLLALALKRQLGVSYPTAWLIHQIKGAKFGFLTERPLPEGCSDGSGRAAAAPGDPNGRSSDELLQWRSPWVAVVRWMSLLRKWREVD